MVPVTTAGRMLGGLVAIVGIGTLALFSGLITVGFLDQLRIRKEQQANTKGAPEICRIAEAPLAGMSGLRSQ
jgi:voltage-gated potassium channel